MTGPSSATATSSSVEGKRRPNRNETRFDCFAIENEEWILRLQNLQEEQQEQHDKNATDDNNNNNDDEHLPAIKTILYASKLANLQCASEAYREGDSKRSTSNINNLLFRVQHEIDTDGAHHESMLNRILANSNPPSNERPSQPPSISKDYNFLDDDELCTSIDIDAFFDCYPECGRPRNEGADYDSESDSDSDSDNEEESISRHRKKRTLSSKKIASMTVDLVEAASEPIQTQEQSQPQAQTNNTQASNNRYSQHQRGHPVRNTQQTSANKHHGNANDSASAAIQNPYSNRKQSKTQSSSSVPFGQGSETTIDLSGTATDNSNTGTNRPLQPSAQARGTNSFQNNAVSHRSNGRSSLYSNINTGSDDRRGNNNNNGTQRRPMDSNPYRRASSSQPQLSSQPKNQSNDFYEPDSNSNEAWMDHRNQTNPFQTAREVALAEKKHPHKDPFRNRGGDGPSRTKYQNPRPQQQQHEYQQQQTQFNHSYGHTFQGGNGGPSDHFNVSGTPAAPSGGQNIPKSLTKKYQPPKRGLGSRSQGLNSRSTNHRSQLRHPASNSNGANNNYNNNGSNHRPSNSNTSGHAEQQRTHNKASKGGGDEEEELPEELQHLDKELVKKIQNEIMESGDTVTFDDIAGLDDAKATVQEVVCWPMKRPDLFTGLRRAPNGLLLYGPPGTGKTLIGKAIAHESGATFFSISSSSMTSKWIGEGEKLVKTLFAVAAYNEPAVVFIDEIDSLLTQRKSSENEASRRIKTEFLVQLDGTGTTGQGRVLIIGATNRPQELDEAARRRFTKRLYIPLPVENDRKVLLKVLLKTNNHVLTEEDISNLARDTKGFSGADLKSLCTDAAMGPIRQLGARAMEININDVPPISSKHFKKSLRGTRPSVAPGDLVQYVEWDKTYGTKRYDEDEDD